MRARASKDGLTLRLIAGTNNILLAFDLDEGKAKRKDFLGFTVERTDLDTGDRRWLPNMIRFAKDANRDSVTSARAPIQKFRWGDYTLDPGRRYRYRAVARFGTPDDIVKQGVLAEKPNGFDAIGGGVSLEIKTEDNRSGDTAVFFNRGAAASEAYARRFGENDPDKIPEALTWLSRGLEEAILAFLAKAADSTFALHAVVYEFQKDNLLDGLKKAKARGADVAVVYHARQKPGKNAKGEPVDPTKTRNEQAIADAGIGDLVTPRAASSGLIMHNKFVVLLQKKAGGKLDPVAVWTGSTNWTEGGIYGQLNVGHAVYDPAIAAKYDAYFKLLKQDPDPPTTKAGVEKITKVPANRAAVDHGVTAIFSPQKTLAMLDLYAEICRNAKLLMISAPFLLHEKIRTELDSKPEGTLRYILADKEGTFGKVGAIDIVQNNPADMAAVATILKSPLNDFQGRLLMHAQSFHHAGVHIHSKIIAADPFGHDPILITGSANFSTNSTTGNDSNSLIVRGDSAVMDIYATEFMRMFDHYWFRYRKAQEEKKAQAKAAKTKAKTKGERKPEVLVLKDDGSWALPYFKAGEDKMRERLAFSGVSS